MKSEREVLEEAIVADPEDRAAHAAYADLLAEQGDPRGEFIRVQLALEDETLPATQRKVLQRRERALAKEHGREWFGRLAPVLIDLKGLEGYQNSESFHPRARFVRGLLAELTFPRFCAAHAQALIAADVETRFVRRLLVDHAAYEDEDDAEPDPEVPEAAERPGMQLLARWPNLASLRALRLGEEVDEDYGSPCGFNCDTTGEFAHEYAERMPRLEELYLLAHDVDTPRLFALPMRNLRVLQVYHSQWYDLEALAANPTLGRLTHLQCHPHAVQRRVAITLDGLRALCRSPHLESLAHLRLRLTTFGDDGVREIVNSGLLKRLRSLDLRHGRVTDTGAYMLANWPDARRLEWLDLTDNELTEAGVRALASLGVRVETGHQHTSTAGMSEDQLLRQAFLYQGDLE